MRKARLQRWVPAAILVSGLAVASVAVNAAQARFLYPTGNPGNAFSANTLSPPSGLTLTPSCTPATAISFRSATAIGGHSGSIAITKPTGTAAGDTMLAQIALRDDTSLTPPTGWTLVHRSTTSPYTAVYVKVAGADEPATYTWIPGGVVRHAAGIATFQNVYTVTPVDGHSDGSGSGSPIIAPSLTTSVPNTMLVALWSNHDNTGVTPPGSMVERWDIDSNSQGSKVQQVQVAAATETFSGSGTTGNRSATTSADTAHVGIMVALRPNPGTITIAASWTATPSTWASGHKLSRWLGAAQQNEQTITPRTTVNASDGPVSPGQTYTYKLTAFAGTWLSSIVSANVASGTC